MNLTPIIDYYDLTRITTILLAVKLNPRMTFDEQDRDLLERLLDAETDMRLAEELSKTGTAK